MVTDAPAALPDEQRLTVPNMGEAAGETAGEPAGTRARRWSPAAVVIWVLFAGGITLFIAFARVPIAAGWRQDRSMRVLDIWSLFTLELAQVAGPWVSPVLVTILVLVVLAGSLLGLWLAMSVTSERPSERPD